MWCRGIGCTKLCTFIQISRVVSMELLHMFHVYTSYLLDSSLLLGGSSVNFTRLRITGSGGTLKVVKLVSPLPPSPRKISDLRASEIDSDAI